jgi:hypothetical protein
MTELEQTENTFGSEEELKATIEQLADRIQALTDSTAGKVEDVAEAQQMAQTIKPHIDRLASLNALLLPIDRIVAKRHQIHDLNVRIEDDIAAVEDITRRLSNTEDPLLSDLNNEIAAVKQDRKLYIEESSASKSRKISLPKRKRKARPESLEILPIEERFTRILSERFISLDTIQSVFSVSFSSAQVKKYQQNLEHLWNSLFSKSEFRPYVEQSALEPLTTAFSDYAILFRTALLQESEPTTLSSLREYFPGFFIQGQSRGMWYSKQSFYHTPMRKPHWALIDKQYLNCTFKKPSLRLKMYAKANGLPLKMVRQKTALEDTYDRIATELTLRERFFDNCNSITGTVYTDTSAGQEKQVFLYYKDHCIRISGKSGIPHWKPNRPRWPGLLPTIALPY